MNHGTNTIHLLHHLDTFDLPQRMAYLNSKHFSRILRTSRTSILANMLHQDYWSIIQFWIKPQSIRHIDFHRHQIHLIDNHMLKHMHPQRKRYLPHRHALQYWNTIVWNLVKTAVTYHNDDFTWLCLKQSSTPFTAISPNISFYIQPLQSIHPILSRTTLWRDFASIGSTNLPPNDLLIFTDGSNLGGAGGYGYLIIPSDLYQQWAFTDLTSPPSYTDGDRSQRGRFLHRLFIRFNEFMVLNHNPYLYAQSTPLSTRCSIDFCEALAIHDALLHLVNLLKTDVTLDLSVFHAIRIISDSETVLRYISGQYQIRQLSMFRIITSVHQSTHTLQRKLESSAVIYQKCKAHDITFGNEYADYQATLAVKQVLAAMEKSRWLGNVWRYLSSRAACRRARAGILEHHNHQLRQAVNHAVIGKPYQSPPSTNRQWLRIRPWQRTYRNDMKCLTRDSIRILIALRTGHDHLRYYQCYRGAKSITNPNCDCGKSHTIAHLLRNCPLAQMNYSRAKLRRDYLRMIHEYLFTLTTHSSDHKFVHEHLDKFQFTNVLTYTDPPTRFPQSLRIQIMGLIIAYYRKIVGYYAPTHSANSW